MNDATAFTFFWLGSGNEESGGWEIDWFLLFQEIKLWDQINRCRREGWTMFCLVYYNPLYYAASSSLVTLLTCCVPGIRFQPVHPTEPWSNNNNGFFFLLFFAPVTLFFPFVLNVVLTTAMGGVLPARHCGFWKFYFPGTEILVGFHFLFLSTPFWPLSLAKLLILYRASCACFCWCCQWITILKTKRGTLFCGSWLKLGKKTFTLAEAWQLDCYTFLCTWYIIGGVTNHFCVLNWWTV